MEDYVEISLLGLVTRVRVKLTTLGRATARAGLGHTAPKSPPRGMLSEWLWSNLVRLYRAGPNGMATDVPRGTPQEERPRPTRPGSFSNATGARARSRFWRPNASRPESRTRASGMPGS